jgi:putative peptidoglycan lipid II flippase
VDLLLQHGAEHLGQATDTASVLAMFALGLPGFCVFFLAIRAFQAMQDTRAAFMLYLVENGTNIAIAFLLFRDLGAKGLALSYSVAYSVAAVVALLVLRKRLGAIGGQAVLRSLLRSGSLSIAMALVVAFISALIGTGYGLAGWIKLFVAVGAGLIVYVGGAGAAASFSPWQNARRQRLGPTTWKGGRNAGNQGRHGQRQ